MKKINVFAAVILILLIGGCSQNETFNAADEESLSLKSASMAGKYIVVLKDDAGIARADLQTRNVKVKEKAFGLLKKYDVAGEIEEVYQTVLQGFAVKMAPGQAKKLGDDVDVKYVEADQIIVLSPINATGKPAPQPVAQSIPWGITRVNGGISGIGKTAWIIDSGIDLDHPDLTVDVARSRTFLGGTSTPDDQNGHGTHVAGTIAAKNNSIGVVGVAAGATVVSVRVLDRRGSGSTSGVIAGVDYVASVASLADVANMSLGGGVSATLDNAVLNASAKVKFALAAGNESDNANNHSPARVNGANIYTISAMGTGDKWASYSNYGNPPVDYCAPGSSVYSTYKGGGYATLSGTSMATPHVAGLLLLGAIRNGGTVSGDPDGNADVIAVH
ncbi:MAG: S8 family serine peptidase [Prolixibacteraceae bacterium]|nr:S8 family serine peptidase [Prolixibacteraceae bacterium]